MSTDGSIPGFNADETWALKMLIKDAVAEGIDEAACVRELREAVFGNGADGLKTVVTRHDERIGNLVWWNRATIAATLSAVGAVVVSLVR